MTAHSTRLVTITPEAIEAFARYYLDHHEHWGVFEYSLGCGNFKFGASGTFGKYPPDVSQLVRFFEQLTPSQRRRLRDKAQDKAGELRLVKLSSAALAHEARR